MSARALIVILAALLAVVLLLTQAQRPPAAEAPPRRARSPQPSRSRTATAPVPDRNVFEYASRPAPEARVAPPAVARPAPILETPPPAAPAVRLVGLVRRGGVLKAALSVQGETVIVGAGEAAGDYRVVSIDEDGVRLRAADGSMVTLVTPGP